MFTSKKQTQYPITQYEHSQIIADSLSGWSKAAVRLPAENTQYRFRCFPNLFQLIDVLIGNM
jgi:hypothetical protein